MARTFATEVVTITKLGIGDHGFPTDAVDDDEFKDILYEGVRLLQSIITKARPDLSHWFSVQKDLDNSTPTLSLNNVESILGIHRQYTVNSTEKLFNAREIPQTAKGKIADILSIYYAEEQNPVFYYDAGNLVIKPTPTSDEKAEVVYLSNSVGASGTDHDISDPIGSSALSQVANFPQFAYYPLVLYACGRVLMVQLSWILKQLPKDLDDTTAQTIFDVSSVAGIDVSDAMDKASDLVNKGIQTDEVSGVSDDAQPQSGGFWLADEDPEMVSATLNTAAQEISRAGALVSEYNTEVAIKLQAMSAQMSKLNQEYQWISGQLANVEKMLAREMEKLMEIKA